MSLLLQLFNSTLRPLQLYKASSIRAEMLPSPPEAIPLPVSSWSFLASLSNSFTSARYVSSLATSPAGFKSPL